MDGSGSMVRPSLPHRARNAPRGDRERQALERHGRARRRNELTDGCRYPVVWVLAGGRRRIGPGPSVLLVQFGGRRRDANRHFWRIWLNSRLQRSVADGGASRGVVGVVGVPTFVLRPIARSRDGATGRLVRRPPTQNRIQTPTTPLAGRQAGGRWDSMLALPVGRPDSSRRAVLHRVLGFIIHHPTFFPSSSSHACFPVAPSCSSSIDSTADGRANKATGSGSVVHEARNKASWSVAEGGTSNGPCGAWQPA